MKIAILSDIHGNIDALKAVSVKMRKLKIDLIFSLGDHLGYYGGAQEVFNEIKEWENHMIAGNHERIFLEFLEEDEAYRNNIINKYGSSYLKYEETFDDELIAEISKLPSKKEVEIDAIKFLLCHGSPLNKDQYIYPDTTKEILNDIEPNNVDYVFMGHTHYPMVYMGKRVMMINVGSVGQSRTIGGIANWGVFDTENKVYIPQNTPYEVSRLEKELKEDMEKEYLFKILRRR